MIRQCSASTYEQKTYIDADKVDLGVSVLAGLGGRHLHDLAGTTYGEESIIAYVQHKHGSVPFMTTCPFLRRAEHCMGNVAEAPALA